jgi:hypothetical protein
MDQQWIANSIPVDRASFQMGSAQSEQDQQIVRNRVFADLIVFGRRAKKLGRPQSVFRAAPMRLIFVRDL